MIRISKYLPRRIKFAIKAPLANIARRWIAFNPYIKCSYSQEGEDLVVARLLSIEHYTRTGFYIDIGAHHPLKYSNTQFFYERRWHGINIDANPGGMAAFQAYRPRDINLNLAIAEKEQTLMFYEFNMPELNSFSKELSEARGSVPGCTITNTRPVAARRLNSVLKEFLPSDTIIDFMSIDVEGFDLEVIRSNDWQKYRPLLVLAEDSTANTLRQACSSGLTEFMQSVGYELVSKTALTLIFAEKTRIAGSWFGVQIK